MNEEITYLLVYFLLGKRKVKTFTEIRKMQTQYSKVVGGNGKKKRNKKHNTWLYST